MEKLKIIYETTSDNFEGNIEITIHEKIIEHMDLNKELKSMAEASDGDASHSIVCVYGMESNSRYRTEGMGEQWKWITK